MTFFIGIASVWSLTETAVEIAPGLPIEAAVSPNNLFAAGTGMGGTGLGACRGSDPILDRSSSSDTVERKSKTTSLRIISHPKAAYTDEARKKGIEGSVLVKVCLLASRKVGAISVVRGLSDDLNEKAVEAARQIRFEPKKVNGQPVSTVRTFEYTFSIY